MTYLADLSRTQMMWTLFNFVCMHQSFSIKTTHNLTSVNISRRVPLKYRRPHFCGPPCTFTKFLIASCVLLKCIILQQSWYCRTSAIIQTYAEKRQKFYVPLLFNGLLVITEVFHCMTPWHLHVTKFRHERVQGEGADVPLTPSSQLPKILPKYPELYRIIMP